MDKEYIAKQAKIAQLTNNELVKKDCYWRFLSNSNFTNLSADGSLTAEQYQQAEQMCKEVNN